MAAGAPRKFEIGEEVIDTHNKRKGVVIDCAFWQESRVWEYLCQYTWYTGDDLNSGDYVNWLPIQHLQIDRMIEAKLRPVEKYRYGDVVIHPAKKLKGVVQNGDGWKEVAQVYAVQCLWRWRTDELKGLDTIWTDIDPPTVGYPEEQELQKDF